MKELAEILDKRAPGMALATVVKTTGSSYRRPGARMLISADGAVTGSISGGCLEQDVIEHARKVCATAEPILLSYDTTMEEDVLFGVGLGCKGVIEILVEPLNGPAGLMLDQVGQSLARGESCAFNTVFRSEDAQRIAQRVEQGRAGEELFTETIRPPIDLVVFGAGFDAIPLSRFAKDLGFRVTVVDRRAAYATSIRFPGADDVRILEGTQIDELHLGARAAAVVMAHHYVTDRDYLRALLAKPLHYLGVMGPRRRCEKMLQEFRDEGLMLGDELLSKLHNPVGLDIGAEGPEQIALAILSEICAAFAGHNGGMLREKKGPIHSPRTALS